jgi:hypothetical protein
MKWFCKIGEFRGIGVYMHATFLILIGRDLPSAMRLHKQVMVSHPSNPEGEYSRAQVMVSHPSNPEGEYSRAQIQNIVDAVVPNGKLLDAQLELTRTHFEHEGALDARRIPSTPLLSGMPQGCYTR